MKTWLFPVEFPIGCGHSPSVAMRVTQLHLRRHSHRESTLPPADMTVDEVWVITPEESQEHVTCIV